MINNLNREREEGREGTPLWGAYVGTVDKDRVKWQDEQLDSEFTDDTYFSIYSKRNGYFSIVENDPETVKVDLAVE